jgi:protein phosphatase-4 regulatory subunit 3
MATNDSRRRVKFYVLNDMRQWDDKGTGYVSWVVNDKQRCVSIVVKSEVDGKLSLLLLFITQTILEINLLIYYIFYYKTGSILLDSKILVSIVYQKQQDTLIVWSDMDKRDMALSFQERVGCDEIWEKICEVSVT